MPASKSPINLLRISYGVTDFTRFGLPGSTVSTDDAASFGAEPYTNFLDATGPRRPPRPLPCCTGLRKHRPQSQPRGGGLNPPEVAERYIRAAQALTRAGEARRPERGVAQEGPHVPVIFEHASVAGGGAVLLRMFMPRSDALARFPRYPAHLSQRSGEGAPWQMATPMSAVV